MSDEAPDISINATVTYSVRELLKDLKTDQTKGFASLGAALEHKADKGDVQRLETRLDGQERARAKQQQEIETLKGKAHDIEVAAAAINEHQARRWTYRERLLTTIASLSGLGLMVAALIQLHVL